MQKGLFFRGAGTLPFGKAVRSVRELIEYLLYGTFPAALDVTTTHFKTMPAIADRNTVVQRGAQVLAQAAS